MAGRNTPEKVFEEDDEDEGEEDELDYEEEEGEDDDDQIPRGTSKAIPAAGTVTSTIDEILRGLEKEKLVDLIHSLVRSGPKNHKIMLEWMSKNVAKPATNEIANVDDRLLEEYWDELEESIVALQESDPHGDDEGFEVVDILEKIEALLINGNVSRGGRRILLENLLETDDLFDYGFNTEATSVLFKACKDREDWQFLVNMLRESGDVDNSRLVARIYKEHLHDDGEYLKAREAALATEADYLDLAEYHAERGDIIHAIEVAEKGLLSTRSGGPKLVDFLFDHYAKEERSEDLSRIVDVATRQRVADTKLLDHLFLYFKDRGDYDRAKDALLRSIDLLGYKDDPYDRYQMLRNYLSTEDWTAMEPAIVAAIKKKSARAYLRICMDNGLTREILATIIKAIPKVTDKKVHRAPSNPVEDEFAAKLVQEFPEKIAEYYWKMALVAVACGNAGAYRDARRYLVLAKDVFTNALKKQKEWETRFSALKDANRRRRSFLKEVEQI
jgi:tetratricopeptide (TPR) repeat protein